MSSNPTPNTESSTHNLPKLTIIEKAGYGCGDLASNFIWQTMSLFLSYYYTDIFGLAPAAVALLSLFARCFDGVVDIVVGAVADRTNTKMGKFRPYLLWWCLPLAIIFVLNFTVPPASWNKTIFTLPTVHVFGNEMKGTVVGGMLVYAWVTYTLLMAIYSAINIPYGALSGVMTDEPNDRNSLGAFRMAFANIGGLLVTGLTFPLTAYFGQGDKQKGYHGAVVVFAILLVIFFLITFFTTRERILPPPHQKSNLGKDLVGLFGNGPWVIMVIFAIINMTLVIARSSDTAYYFKYTVGLMDDKMNTLSVDILGHHLFNWDYISWLYVWGSLTFILGTMFTKPAVKLLGKKFAMVATVALAGAALIPYYYVKPGQIGAVMLITLVVQLFGGVNAALYWSMLGDIADYTEWKFKIRNTGLIFSSTTFAQKVGMGMGGFVLGEVLDKYGYQANAAQTPESLHGINMLMSYVPCIGLLVIAGLFFFYKLDDKFCTMMRTELNARRAERDKLGAV